MLLVNTTLIITSATTNMIIKLLQDLRVIAFIRIVLAFSLTLPVRMVFAQRCSTC